MPLAAFAMNCTLKPSTADEKSSTDKLLSDLMAALKPHRVDGEIVIRDSEDRCRDHRNGGVQCRALGADHEAR